MGIAVSLKRHPRLCYDEKDGRKSPVFFVCSELATRSSRLVDIELLLVHRRIALHDDGTFGHLLHLVQQLRIV